jgi:leader peptidase (prepilin peptidase)/N-methyltransferase
VGIVVPWVLGFVIAGLILGRLAATAADRIPKHEAMFLGWNRCPRCGEGTGVLDTIPLVGYLLRSRCGRCGRGLPVRYSLTEVAAGILLGLSALKFGFHVEAIVYAAFFWVLLVLSSIDLEYKLLPDRIVFPSLAVGGAGLVVAALVRGEPERLVHAAVGAAIFGGFLFVVAFVYPAGMGGGDVKLSFLLGMFLGYLDGWGVVLVGMFLSFVLGGVIGVLIMLITGGGRKMQVPFGPFLAMGTTLAIFVGHALLTAYLG